jgi:hypothetical protein
LPRRHRCNNSEIRTVETPLGPGTQSVLRPSSTSGPSSKRYFRVAEGVVVSQAVRYGPWMPRLARRSCRVAVFALESKHKELPSIAPRWPHSESLGPEYATTWPASRRCVAFRSSIAGVACRADGCVPSGGRARSESVSASCAMVGWALSIGLIDLPFSHWTHVTFKHLSPPDPTLTLHSVTSEALTTMTQE